MTLLRKRIWYKLACGAFCLVMTGWLIRYEAFPSYFTERAAGYRGMLTTGALLVDQWTKISYDGAPIGYSHTQLASHEEDEDEEDMTRLQNRTYLELKVLGRPQRILVTATLSLDAAYRLQRFDFALSSSPYSARIYGERRQGEQFAVEVRSKAGVSRMELDIPDDVVIYSPLTEMGLRKLKPGQALQIRTLDPVSLTVGDIRCRAVGRETIEHRGRAVSAMKLEVSYRGTSVYSWMDDTGRIIRQETPLGWVMEASDQEEALNLQFDADAMADMVLAHAVPLTGSLKQPQTAQSLRLSVHGLLLDAEMLESHRQEVIPVDETTVEVVLTRQQRPRTSLPLGETPPGFEEHLASTAFVQSDHPEIQQTARAIVGDAEDSLAAALRIHEWVEQNITKNATVSLPSALDVLHERVGDCNEHTYLYVALARAVGLPARIRIGLVYNQGALYYHAWPSVYVGEWVEMDPTLRQPMADATHLALLEGEIGNQLELMKVLGQLSVDVLDEVHP